MARHGFVAPLQTTELYVLLAQLVSLLLEVFRVLLDVLLAREQLLVELVELGDHADIVYELLAVAMNLLSPRA